MMAETTALALGEIVLKRLLERPRVVHALAERGEVARDRYPGRSEPYDQARCA